MSRINEILLASVVSLISILGCSSMEKKLVKFEQKITVQQGIEEALKELEKGSSIGQETAMLRYYGNKVDPYVNRIEIAYRNIRKKEGRWNKDIEINIGVLQIERILKEIYQRNQDYFIGAIKSKYVERDIALECVRYHTRDERNKTSLDDITLDIDKRKLIIQTAVDYLQGPLKHLASDILSDMGRKGYSLSKYKTEIANAFLGANCGSTRNNLGSILNN